MKDSSLFQTLVGILSLVSTFANKVRAQLTFMDQLGAAFLMSSGLSLDTITPAT